jgi:predicted AAA+ superfamily ATPase
LIELERRGYEVSYVRTTEGFEVDFLARIPGEPPELIQVCLDISDPSTREREVRGLAGAAAEFPKARAVLLTLDSMAPRPPLQAPIEWLAAASWFLGQ